MHWRAVTVAGMLLPVLAGCGDEGPTDPAMDEPPEVVIIDAPFTVGVGASVEVQYRATDDRGLSLISVSWGTLDAPVELVFPSGREFEDVATHQYAEANSYLITVTATDSDGQTGRAQVEVEVEPSGSAIRGRAAPAARP